MAKPINNKPASKADFTNNTNPRFLEDHEYFESRIFSALNLIIIGIIFLLNTTGNLSWGVWLNILSLWPLFIVSVGISIIFRGDRISKFLGSLFGFLIFVIILTLAIFYPTSSNNYRFFPFIGNDSSLNLFETHRIPVEEFNEVENKLYKFDLGFGEVKINDFDSTDYLYVTSNFSNNFGKLDITKELTDKNLTVSISNKQKGSTFISTGPKHEINLGQNDINADFNFNFGAGSGEIDFDIQKLDTFTTEVGAGNLVIKLAEKSIPKSDMNLKCGLGSIQLYIPKDTGIKINYKVGLGSLTFNKTNISSGVGNSTYFSENYSSANSRMILNVEVGLGSIEIVTQ